MWGPRLVSDPMGVGSCVLRDPWYVLCCLIMSRNHLRKNVLVRMFAQILKICGGASWFCWGLFFGKIVWWRVWSLNFLLIILIYPVGWCSYWDWQLKSVFRCQRYAVLVLLSVAIALKISGLCLAKKIFECCCIGCSKFATVFEKDKSKSHVRKADLMTKLCSAQHILNNGTFTDP